MPRQWIRPITWISLAAFFLANTPGAVVAAARLLSSEPGHSHACRHACCHCCYHEGTPESDCATEETSASQCDGTQSETRFVSKNLTTASEEHHGPPCQSCPCSTGACGHCSVAKVLCCLNGVLLGFPAPCLGQNLAEIPLFFPPAHCSKLIRPPIA